MKASTSLFGVIPGHKHQFFLQEKHIYARCWGQLSAWQMGWWAKGNHPLLLNYCKTILLCSYKNYDTLR